MLYVLAGHTLPGSVTHDRPRGIPSAGLMTTGPRAWHVANAVMS